MRASTQQARQDAFHEFQNIEKLYIGSKISAYHQPPVDGAGNKMKRRIGNRRRFRRFRMTKQGIHRPNGEVTDLPHRRWGYLRLSDISSTRANIDDKNRPIPVPGKLQGWAILANCLGNWGISLLNEAHNLMMEHEKTALGNNPALPFSNVKLLPESSEVMNEFRICDSR